MKRGASETQPSALLSAVLLLHSPAQEWGEMTSNTSLFVKISTESGKAINGGSRERVMEGADFKQVPRFLKSNLISFAYGLTSNKD